MAFSTHLALAQNVQVSGQITDENEMPIPGASVLVKGTSTGAAADLDGNYNISAPANATLVFSFIGYSPKEVAIGNQSQIDVQLEPDVSDLEGSSCSGLWYYPKKPADGSHFSVSDREIAEQPIVDARQALQGRATGVDVTQAGSKPGSAPQVRIRGRRSFNAGNGSPPCM